MMKYFSTVTKKAYDTPEELNEAEAKVIAEEEAKKNKAKQKDARWKEVQDAKKRYFELKDKFAQDYPEEIYGGLLDNFFWY